MVTYTVDEQTISAQKQGPENAQVALLIHGWSSSWFALSPLLEPLSKRFCCIAVDLPGYGNSPPPQERVTITYYANLLADLIRQVTDSPVVLVGHSMGGMISLSLAQRHPVLVERMVLLNPTITGQLSTSIKLAISPITVLERFSLANTVIAKLEPHLLTITDRLMRPVSFADRTGITERDYERLRDDARRPGQGRVRAECYWAMRANNLREKLHEVEAPAMVLWGAEDNTVPLRDAGVVAHEWKQADLRIIPNAGHWPQFETPDITQRYIAAYLGLPLVKNYLEDTDSDTVKVQEAARFLAHSDVGNGLTLAQRSRLASQCRIRIYLPGQEIAHAQEQGTDLYIVQDGFVEVWSDPEVINQELQGMPGMRLATLLPGQITGELSLLDGGRRSAHLSAGDEGATVLILGREQILTLCNDDPPLGTRLLWNIATALALRLRLTNWEVHKLQQRLESVEHNGAAVQQTGIG